MTGVLIGKALEAFVWNYPFLHIIWLFSERWKLHGLDNLSVVMALLLQ